MNSKIHYLEAFKFNISSKRILLINFKKSRESIKKNVHSKSTCKSM